MFVPICSSQFRIRVAQHAHVRKPELDRDITRSIALCFPLERSDKASRKIKYFLVYITTKNRQSPLSDGLGGRRGAQLLRRFKNKSPFQFSIPPRQGRARGRAGPAARSRAPGAPPAAPLRAAAPLPEPPSPAPPQS